MIQQIAELKEEEFHTIRALIYKEAGISLSDGKRHLVQSRLMKRLRHHQFVSYGDYLRLLDTEGNAGKEITFLINSLTTNKTDFFREPHHFDFVRNRIVPEIEAEAKSGARNRRIRMWHAGCSTGQEPYSNAMTLTAALENLGTWDVKLLASDIDTDVLATAKNGIYKADAVAPIPQAFRERFLARTSRGAEAQYEVKGSIRDLIAFRQINLTDDSWPIRPGVLFDAIFCRNVIIYFDKPTQKKLFAHFAQFLAPGGYLFIGHSETLFGISNAFQSQGGTIYRKPVETESALY